MNIVVFDDDMTFINFITKSLDELNKKFNGIFSVSTYCTMNDIIAYADSNKDNASLFILDIMMDYKKVGFSIAEHIKKVNKDNLIIYVTDYIVHILTDNMKHKMYALAFIHKESGCFITELEYAVMTTYELFEDTFFIADCFPLVLRVKYKDVLYFRKEKGSDKIIVVCKNDDIIIKGSLKKLMPTLSGHFCHSAQDFIVNTQLVIGVNKAEKSLMFENGAKCPYSRIYKEELLNKCHLN